MKDDHKLKQGIKDISARLLILFVPELLSPLHIASYKYWLDSKECEKQLNGLSKKLAKIQYRLTGKEEEMDPKELFCKITQHLDSLSLKELKVLHQFSDIIYKQDRLDLRIHRKDEEIIESILEYGEVIDEYIDEKKVKGKKKIVSVKK